MCCVSEFARKSSMLTKHAQKRSSLHRTCQRTAKTCTILVRQQHAQNVASGCFILTRCCVWRVQCLAHVPPLPAARVARLLAQEAIAANNKLPELVAPHDGEREPFSDDEDRLPGGADRCAQAVSMSFRPYVRVVSPSLLAQRRRGLAAQWRGQVLLLILLLNRPGQCMHPSPRKDVAGSDANVTPFAVKHTEFRVCRLGFGYFDGMPGTGGRDQWGGARSDVHHNLRSLDDTRSHLLQAGLRLQ